MKPLISTALAFTLVLSIMPVPAMAVTVRIAQNSGQDGTASARAVTPSVSTNPSSASEHAPGHGTTPPGQGGIPPGQAKKEVPNPDAADPTGFLAFPDFPEIDDGEQQWNRNRH
jgi:hypothetical protein